MHKTFIYPCVVKKKNHLPNEMYNSFLPQHDTRQVTQDYILLCMCHASIITELSGHDFLAIILAWLNQAAQLNFLKHHVHGTPSIFNLNITERIYP